MSLWFFGIAALSLSIERLVYIAVWRRPSRFAVICLRAPVGRLTDPVNALQMCFALFKVLQVGVFLNWCWLYGAGLWPASRDIVVLGGGIILLGIGQILNLSVFQRLGKVGVFYGNRFGRHVPRCVAFPFSLLKHPQYVGALLSIWGFFLLMRFPRPDWFLLPLLQTFYYMAGAYFESDRVHERVASDDAMGLADSVGNS